MDNESQRIDKNILDCYNFYRDEEKDTRNLYIAFWKHLENMFDGIQRTFWDHGTQDWRRVPLEGQSVDSVDPVLYDKIINIYRAHGESLIAALSIKLPNVVFYPDDADVIEDVETAKAYSKIKELVIKHNQGPLLAMKALYLLFNQGVVAAYIYNRAKKDYGTIRIPQYGDPVNLRHYTATCPACSGTIGVVTTKNDEMPVQSEEEFCPDCQTTVTPVIEMQEEQLPQITGYIDEPKSRTVIELFGPMYAHMPFYARSQEHMPYLQLKFEQHNTLLMSLYPNLREKIGIRSGSNIATSDRAARLFNSLQYSDASTLTTTCCQWLRPWAFNCLDKDEAAFMQEKFPEGCYSVIVNEREVAETLPEKLDDCWEITRNPLSNYIHADPMGKGLAPIQEIITDINDLSLESFLHSIPETFANPKVLDFKSYEKSESKPGMVSPAVPEMGKSLGDGFHTIKAATLSDEMDIYDKSMQGKAQFVSGAFPSIFGGPNTTGSKTAQEYSESRAMAMQRLNITFTMFKYFWANTCSKAVISYANGMLEDDKTVEISDKAAAGFVNIWIKQAELTGKVGRVEPDPDEELPTSSSQVRDLYLQLLQLNNPMINDAMLHPMNMQIAKRVIGIPDFYVPGKDQRDKQYAEFADLLKGFPVAIDVDLDDHKLQAQVCESFLVSSTGLAIQKTNPTGYNAIKMHHMEHLMEMQMLTQEEGVTPSGVEPPSLTDTTRA